MKPNDRDYPRTPEQLAIRKRYYFDFKMTGPNNKRANVRATWVQGSDDDKKRLTSVYVIRKGHGEDGEV